MARWPFTNNEAELPERLRGKKPEEVDAALAEAERYRQETETKLQAAEQTSTEVTELRTKIAELEARPTPTPEQLEQQRLQEQQRQQGPTSFLIDEDRAFNERVAPYAQLSLHTASLAARMQAREQAMSNPADRKVWSKYEGEINALMEKEPPQRRAHPQTWLNALTFVKGQHLQDLMKLRDEGTDFFSEEVRSTGAGPGGTEVEGEIKLTAQELEIAKNMKITPEQFLAQKKAFAEGPTLTATLPERSTQ